MSTDVVLSIRGTQTVPGNEPETIELTTAARMEWAGKCVTLTYQESPLTGLSGTVTKFTILPEQIKLERHGEVESQMEFKEGETNASLYQVEGGALLLRVSAQRLRIDLHGVSGSFDLCYGIEIEDTPMGTIDYHITVHPAGTKLPE